MCESHTADMSRAFNWKDDSRDLSCKGIIGVQLDCVCTYNHAVAVELPLNAGV